MRRGLSPSELSELFGAVCVTDTTDWDRPGGFEIWTRDEHVFTDGVCEDCGAKEDDLVS